MRVPFPVAVAVGSLAGSLIICALTSWGDPCTAQGYAGHACPIVLSSAQEHLRDAVLVLIFFGVGLLAGSATSSWRYIAGGLSALMTVPVTTVCGRLIYRVDTPLVPPVPLPLADYAVSVAALVVVFLLGILGAALSRWLPNFRWSGP